MENVRYADILDGISNSWSIKEKAKYIYNEICKRSSYDERFIYSQNPRLLKSIYKREEEILQISREYKSKNGKNLVELYEDDGSR